MIRVDNLGVLLNELLDKYAREKLKEEYPAIPDLMRDFRVIIKNQPYFNLSIPGTIEYDYNSHKQVLGLAKRTRRP